MIRYIEKTITLLALGLTFLLTPNVYAETSGEALFESKCASYHVKMRPSDISTLKAPPIMGVMRNKHFYSQHEMHLKWAVL